MRWLVTGSGGRLGTALIARLTTNDTGLTGAEDDVILPLDRIALDVTDSAAVRETVADFRPDVVVNTAAYSAGEPGSALTAADPSAPGLGDEDEQRVYSVNAVGPAMLALAVAATGGRLVHVSSDLVFAGDATAPYPVDALPAPRSAYGRSKLAGELAVRELLPAHGYVVRTSWLYGGAGDEVVTRALRLVDASHPGSPGSGRGADRERGHHADIDRGRGADVDREPGGGPGGDADGFHSADTGGADDRLGSPTWVADLAEGLITLSRSAAPAGIYHCTNSGQTTRLGFARAVRAELRADPDRAGPEPSARPARNAVHAVLSGREWAAAGLPALPHWRDALHRALMIDGESLRTS